MRDVLQKMTARVSRFAVALSLLASFGGALLGVSSLATAAEAAKAKAPGKVTKIVFVGQKEACDCTRKRVDDSDAALQAALKGLDSIGVERLNLDVDKDKLAPYRAMRAIMVAPAVYLLDDKGALVDMLQGEITTEQFQAALK